MITKSPEETRAAGRAFARTLQPGDVVLLEGPLGSGKTSFVHGLSEGVGSTAPVTSPTFVFLQEYPLTEGRVLRHFDLYRFSDATAPDRIGLPELLDDPQAITVIEWGDRLPPELRSPERRYRRVRFAHGEEPSQRVILED